MQPEQSRNETKWTGLRIFLVQHSAIQAVVVLSLISVFGMMLGKVRFFGISLGVTFVFFIGIAAGHFDSRSILRCWLSPKVSGSYSSSTHWDCRSAPVSSPAPLGRHPAGFARHAHRPDRFSGTGRRARLCDPCSHGATWQASCAAPRPTPRRSVRHNRCSRR